MMSTAYPGESAATEEQRRTFPQSVASGDPGPHGIILWTRVDPEVAKEGGTISWQIGRDPSFAPDTLVTSGTSPIEAAHDHVVKVRVDDPALEPFSVYHYRFLFGRVASRTGRFKTLPRADAQLTSLKLGVINCQDYGSGYYPALAHLAKDDVDYILFLGDYIYESIGSPDFQADAVRRVPPFPSGNTIIPSDLEDYRHLYKVYRSDPDNQALHERFCYIQLWDDHEFGNDCHQDFHPDNNGASGDAIPAQPALRQAANQAWAEYGLADVRFDATKDWQASLRVYRKFSLGTLADLIVTDERLYRDGPPCGNTEFGERYLTIGCDKRLDPARTMLGAAQRDWFLAEVTGSQAIWKLWANEVMLMQVKGAGLFLSLDQWDGYPAERAAIFRKLETAGIENFVALTGDLHTFAAGYLKSDYDKDGVSPVGIELAVGSVTTTNLDEEIEAEAHLPHAPVPANPFELRNDLFGSAIRIFNPHIEYWDSSTHGYAIVTLTPEELVCEFKAVSTVRAPTARLVDLATLRIPAGKAKIDVAHAGLFSEIIDALHQIWGDTL
jgi:alkaline phosphatase D